MIYIGIENDFNVPGILLGIRTVENLKLHLIIAKTAIRDYRATIENSLQMYMKYLKVRQLQIDIDSITNTIYLNRYLRMFKII